MQTQGRTIASGRPATPERWQVAARRAVAEGVTVRQVNDNGMWIATSGSHQDRAYTLEITNGIVHACSCEAAAMYADPVCKHRARFYLDSGQLMLPAIDERKDGS